MRKFVSALTAVAALSTPALAQVRPDDCRPVFPVNDQVAQPIVPQDVIAPRAGPVAPVAKRRFAGLALLPLLLAAGGALIALGGNDNGGSNHPRSPA